LLLVEIDLSQDYGIAGPTDIDRGPTTSAVAFPGLLGLLGLLGRTAAEMSNVVGDIKPLDLHGIRLTLRTKAHPVER
jgi:hypothetical protein